MSVKLIVLGVVVLALLAVAMAYAMGRNSRSYHLVSTLLAPVGQIGRAHV